MEDYLKISGRIFDIQRYSIHDGPGIRTIVFLKGCALRCRWCCNPESQSFEVETMVINGKPKVMGKDVTVEEVMETVKKDLPYYRRSQGGITLSGGECTLQPEFSKGLLKASKEMGISTAIESTAYADYEKIEKLLPYLDYYLMDIKHINAKKHKEYTAQDNKRMLENAKRIAESGETELIIRVPVIPGFNDTKEELLEIAYFAQKLRGVRELHLLPYHAYGKGKYEGLNREYPMGEVKPPTAEKMRELKENIEKNTSLKCQIGG